MHRGRGLAADVGHLAGDGVDGSGIGCLLETRLDARKVAVEETVPAHTPAVEGADGGRRLYALVARRRSDGVSAATTDAERADARRVHAGNAR